MSTTEVYDKTNIALNTLSATWQTMLDIVQAVSAASASSLTAEPDLAKLQKARKDYDQHMTTLKTTVAWLEANELPTLQDQPESEALKKSLIEQEELQKESTRVSDKLKAMLNQSYALQFQMEMLFTSSQDVNLS